MIINLQEKDVILDKRAKGPWCQLVYPNHPKGCPNYAKKRTCPPFSKAFEDLVEPPFYLVIQTFDLEAQARRMKGLHPEWSDKQCRNLLYWQKGLMKRLRTEAEEYDSMNAASIVCSFLSKNAFFNTCLCFCFS